MRYLIRTAITAALLSGLLAEPASAAVWEATESWNETWEERFRQWVKGDFHKDYFHDPNDKLTFGLALDCADAVYTMRILFAYQNGLPFVINDPTNGRTLSQAITKWDNYRPTLKEELDDGTWKSYKGPAYDERQKVRAFIDYVNDITTTISLARDTYPVPLEDIKPGDMYLIPNSHVYIVTDVGPTGVMTTLSASSPRAWRQMAQISDFPAEVPSDKNLRDGYRRFKPTKYLKSKSSRVPGASFAQWKLARKLGRDREAFAMATQDALAQVKEPLPQKAQRLFSSLCDYAIARVDVVNIGLDAYRRLQENHGNQCMGIGQYAEYSTPSRDAKLKGQYRVLASLMQNDSWKDEWFPLKTPIQAIFSDNSFGLSEDDLKAYCSVPVDILNGHSMSLRAIWHRLEAGHMTSDPHAPLAYRWGLAQDKWKPTCKVAKQNS